MFPPSACADHTGIGTPHELEIAVARRGPRRHGLRFRATCNSKCLNDSSVTLRFQIERYNGSVWPWVVFNYTGFAAKVGGSTSVEYSNASPGLYRARCEVDFTNPNRDHSFADVISEVIEQVRTDDVTPPTVGLPARRSR